MIGMMREREKTGGRLGGLFMILGTERGGSQTITQRQGLRLAAMLNMAATVTVRLEDARGVDWASPCPSGGRGTAERPALRVMLEEQGRMSCMPARGLAVLRSRCKSRADQSADGLPCQSTSGHPCGDHTGVHLGPAAGSTGHQRLAIV
jgi:hypothetical protein